MEINTWAANSKLTFYDFDLFFYILKHSMYEKTFVYLYKYIYICIFFQLLIRFHSTKWFVGMEKSIKRTNVDSYNL